VLYFTVYSGKSEPADKYFAAGQILPITINIHMYIAAVSSIVPLFKCGGKSKVVTEFVAVSQKVAAEYVVDHQISL
jgi:hypothetical protein